jgi:hypothetical protein
VDDGNLVVWRRKASSQEETRCDKFAIPKYKHPACWIATQKGQLIHELGLSLKMPRCNKTKHCSKNEAVTKKRNWIQFVCVYISEITSSG